MKIEYTSKPPIKNPTLGELNPGDVFRPINSLNIFMCCDICGSSHLLSDCLANIWEYTTHTGSEPFNGRDEFSDFDYDELIVCTHLATGSVTLFYQGIEVKKVNCKLLAEEE